MERRHLPKHFHLPHFHILVVFVDLVGGGGRGVVSSNDFSKTISKDIIVIWIYIQNLYQQQLILVLVFNMPCISQLAPHFKFLNIQFLKSHHVWNVMRIQQDENSNCVLQFQNIIKAGQIAKSKQENKSWCPVLWFTCFS